jgi:hypothetical protein
MAGVCRRLWGGAPAAPDGADTAWFAAPPATCPATVPTPRRYGCRPSIPARPPPPRQAGPAPTCASREAHGVKAPPCRAAAVLRSGGKTGRPVPPWLGGKVRVATAGLLWAWLSGRTAFPPPSGQPPVPRRVRARCPKCPAFAPRRFYGPTEQRDDAGLRLRQRPAPARWVHHLARQVAASTHRWSSPGLPWRPCPSGRPR